ncbi:MAG: GAF domain-containing protein [Cyclobacteriaceae bacterium]|nr:GAF domain-containing protein [Cyclobacteriaceae bacterium]
MHKIFLVLIGICCSILSLRAQFNHFQNYTVEDGLPQSQVQAIYEDDRGNLWFGTNGGGLCRFTGNGFETYTRRDGLLSDIILEITENINGELVIRSMLGLSVFDGQKFENFPFTNINFNSIPNLNRDSVGNFWFKALSNEQKPEIYRFDGEKYINFSAGYDQFKDLKVRNFMVQDGQGNMVFSIGRDIYFYAGEELQRHPLSGHPLLTDQTIIYFHLDRKDNLWIFTVDDNGQPQGYLYNEDLEKVNFPSLIDFHRINAFFEDRDGNFWLINPVKNELYHWTGGPGNDEVNVFSDRYGPDFSSIKAISQDHEGNIWFGSDGNGIYKYGGSKFISFQSSQGLDNHFIWSLYQDTKGTIWFGTANEGLISWDGDTLVHYPPDETAFPGIIRAIFEHEGRLMVGGSKGLWSLDGNTYQHENKRYGLAGDVGVAEVFPDGNQIWIGTYNHGLFRHMNGTVVQYNQENSALNHNQVDNIIRTGDGLLWIATRGGLTRYDGKEFKTFQHSGHIGFTALLQLTEDRFGYLWAATYGAGVFRILIDENDQLEVFRIDSEFGLSSDNVYSILTDTDGNIWAGCQNGADKITLDEDGSILDIRNYDNFEGFTGFENNAKANLVSRDGRLWFGTIKGAMVYDPVMDKINEFPPRTNVTSLQLFYKDVDWNDESYTKYYTDLTPWTKLPENLVLPFNRNHITFEFEGLSYSVPEKVLFQWMLEGVDQEWSPPSERSYSVYTNLNPGFYTFKVKAANNDGIWNEVPTEFSFQIKPPFWGTWWFRSIVFTFIVALIIIISWLRNKVIREKREELEQLVAFKTKKLEHQKAEILQKNEALKAQYNNLEMLSKIGRDITANLTVESLLDSIYKKLNSLMDAPVLGIGILNRDKDSVDFPYLLKNGKNVGLKSIPFEDEQSLAIKSIRENREIIIHNITAEDEGKYLELHLPGISDDSYSVVFLPLFYNNKPLGVLTVQSFKPDSYTEYHLNILRNLATYTKIALENAHAYEKIQDQKEKLTQANQNISLQKTAIEESNKKLQELNQEKNNIIGIVAHDLKNPLTSALTMVTILKNENNNLNQDQKLCIEIIEKSVVRMNDMISRLLDIKKIEDKIIKLRLEKVNLEQIIHDVNKNLLNEINRKKIHFSVFAEELYAKVDPDYAVQVFENLLSNAIKFSPPEKNVTVKLLKNNGKARAEIIDEGPGLTEDDKKKVFGKFQRLSARPTGGEQSTGLGLSIVKKYVEAMHGKVWCESEYGKGANFIVEFKRVD